MKNPDRKEKGKILMNASPGTQWEEREKEGTAVGLNLNSGNSKGHELEFQGKQEWVKGGGGKKEWSFRHFVKAKPCGFQQGLGS